MKMHFPFLVFLLGLLPFIGFSQPKVYCTTTPIWAIYTHGEDLPELSEAQFEFKNEEAEPVAIVFMELSYVEATFNLKGGVTAKDEKPIPISFGQDGPSYLENQPIMLEGGGEWKKPFRFAPFSVDSCYPHNWQGFVLKYKAGGMSYEQWLEVNLEREEPYRED